MDKGSKKNPDVDISEIDRESMMDGEYSVHRIKAATKRNGCKINVGNETEQVAQMKTIMEIMAAITQMSRMSIVKRIQ